MTTRTRSRLVALATIVALVGLAGPTVALPGPPGFAESSATAPGQSVHPVDEAADVGAESPTLKAVSEVETARGPYVRLAAMEGSNAIVRVHQWGTVAAMAPDGETIWNRSGLGLADEWGLVPGGAAPRTVPDTRRFTTGAPLALLDASGDGVDDVVVAHEVAGKTVVTLLDGSDGSVMWFGFLPGDVHFLAAGAGTIFVAHHNGEPRGQKGEPGGVTEVLAWRFVTGGSGLLADELWRFSTGESWATWERMIVTESGVVAAAWYAAGRTHLAVVSASTGDVRWRTEPAGEIQFLGHDAGREELVVAEMQTLPLGLHYTVRALALIDGTQRAATLTRPLGPVAMVVEDVTGDGLAEWVLTEGPWGEGGGILISAVVVFDADTTLPRWEQPLAVMEARPMMSPGLVVAQARVFVAETEDMWGAGHTDTTLRAFDGATGQSLWSRLEGDQAYPSTLIASQVGGSSALYAVTSRLEFRSYALHDGAMLADVPILSNIYNTIVADVNDDGVKDFLVGTESGGVFALDGTGLDLDSPGILWRAKLKDSVHELHLVDLEGDGELELVAAAEREVAVLDSATGTPRYAIPKEDEYAWTLAVADVDGDGTLDLVVPTRAIDAYRGSDGEPLWSYQPDLPPGTTAYFSNAAITPGSRVVAQYTVAWHVDAPSVAPIVDTVLEDYVVGSLGFPVGRPVPGAAVGLDGATGVEIWRRPLADTTGVPALWRGVAANPAFPIGDGHAVAVTDFPLEHAYALTHHILDARTGEALTAPLLGTEGPFRGLETLVTGQWVAYTWRNASLIDVDGLRSRRSGSSIEDAASADFGPWGTHVALATNVVFAVPEDGFETAPVVQSFSHEMRVKFGALTAADLDGDGIDEIVTFEKDWEGHNTVYGFTGGATWTVNAHIHGLNVLRLVPPGASGQS